MARDMNLVDTLLRAIVRQDADAMVLHVGDPPYLIAASGTVELSTRPLTAQSLSGLTTQLLPPDQLRVLNEFGSVEHTLEPDAPDGERFVVVATKARDDLWVELRRQRRVVVPERPRKVDPVWPNLVRALAASSTPDVVGPPTGEPKPPASVVPLVRSPVRDQPHGVPVPRGTWLERLLKIAAARGASALYVTAESPPLVRVDGEMVAIGGEPPLDLSEVESVLFELAPIPRRDDAARGNVTEWVTHVPEIGRVRCTTFRDSRGPGAVFQMISTRAISAEQLGLSPAILALADEPHGLLLVTGPRASGKSTLIAALVELINRRRPVHVITIEPQIKVVHESRRAFVSQREVRGGPADVLAELESALREDPDVVVLEELHAAEVTLAAVDAADAGRLVLATTPAPGAAIALERIIDQCQPDQRVHLYTTLGSTLRAVIAQTLVRRRTGGRVAARELLLNTPAVAHALNEGRTSQLPRALAAGGRQGMLLLNDALADLVLAGTVAPHEAYRNAYDREGLIARLRRDGIDTSGIELLA